MAILRKLSDCACEKDVSQVNRNQENKDYRARNKDMADPELDRIRQQRLAQLQQQYGGGDSAQNQKAMEERARAMEEAKHSILSQILSQDARARLNTLKLSKPEKGQMVEEMIVRMAQSGQIRGQINEKELIGILESVNQQMPKSNSTVKFDRRRAALDSDDEL